MSEVNQDNKSISLLQASKSWRRTCNVPLPAFEQSNSEHLQDDTITSSEDSKSINNFELEKSQLSQSSPPPPPLTSTPSPPSPADDSNEDPDFINSTEESSSSCSDVGEFDDIITEITNETSNDKPCKKIHIISNVLLNNAPNEKNQSDGNRSKNFCIFCETSVLNFARHLKRQHLGEFEVQKAFSFSAKSKMRKELLSGIRKKGNFLKNEISGKPIKTATVHTKTLPCPDCYGVYSSKSLWRHRKKCSANPQSNHQSESQNFLLRNIRVDNDLRQIVFPRMRADEVSLVAKKDPIISQFGAQYIKIHREKHFVNVASRKMRELAKLLIEVRKIDASTHSFLDALKPEKFEILVEATKIIAKYNKKDEFFLSPTLAMNLGTSLKQCCDLALLNVYQKKFSFSVSSAEMESDLKTLIHLIESQWKYQISSQAANDLSINKWNKVTLLPLASDLKILKDFLMQKGNSAEISLQNNGGKQAYTELLETVYCRVILLNRRRPGELQRLLLRTYNSTSAENKENYEEFFDLITPTEKILIKTYKRVVIRGKRGRGVPVLFSPDVQSHLNTLLKYRDKFVKAENLYLFGNPNTLQPLYGYKIFRKYSNNCGAKNPNALTCTKLRKHMATLAQIFNMSENDLEQLATFMGHTIGIHRQAYRLPDDVYQTAKISKLLMLMENGNATQFKGKNLDEIELNLETEPVYDHDNEIDDILDNVQDISTEPGTSKSSDENMRKELVVNLERMPNKVSGTSHPFEDRKKKRILVPWTQQQKEVVNKFFVKHIQKKIPPKRQECTELINKYPDILHNKDWLKIKVYVQNKYTLKLK